MQVHKKILFLKREYITQTETFYETHGGKAVILARFMPIIRTIAPFVAGAGSMTYSKYILYCIIGAVLWVNSITLIGYFLGNNEWVKANFEKVVLGIVVVSIMGKLSETSFKLLNIVFNDLVKYFGPKI